MQLTTYSDYALRTLMYVGVRGGGAGRLSKIQEIAGAYDISRNHLMKIVQFLGEQGYLENVRGKNGGIRLRKAPAEINVGELVRRTEGNLYLVACFDQEARACRIEPHCRLRGALGEALDAFFAVLDGYTLADLLGPNRELAGDLGISVA